MDEIMHYGTPRHSGRYPWGSGDDPYQRNKSFIGYIDDLRSQGLSEVEIARGLDMSVKQLREQKSIAKDEMRAANAREALRLKDKGYSNVAIGERMGLNESSVRELLKPATADRANITKATADMLKQSVDAKGYIDIGAGMENHIGVSRTKLNTAVAMLEDEGYTVHYIKVEQVGQPGQYTYIKTLAPPDTTYSEVYNNRDQIKMVTDYTEDGGRSYLGLEPIKSVTSDRVQIVYGDQGGSEKDGVIELRRGVEDISLGDARYAQVRIGVDDTHYLKGMAIYNDNMPDGVDILYNTNKKTGTPKESVFKSMKDDPDNPFGATIRQRHYIDADGNEQLSALNLVASGDKVNVEGRWGEWRDSLSSQFLSKQSPALAKKQLDLAYDIQNDEFTDIMQLTNPAVKKILLEKFADGCDSAASDLKGAALPRQGSHVILPVTDMKETEIYAPNYNNGEQVALVRYPHGGTFEIPTLTVNNKQETAKSLFGNAKDAVGINPKVAERLSGADFDGDTVLVIPTRGVPIRTSSPLKGLENFDPKTSYPGYEGMKVITSQNKQTEMGKVSNLITDMTIKGANDDEIARAVRHSMVVIDAEKHKLDYKGSYVDNGIAELKQKYQGKTNAGASTLISKAGAVVRVPNRKEIIDPETGKKTYLYPGDTYTTAKGEVKVYKGDTYTNKKGEPVNRLIKSTRMKETDDARTLSSGTRIEEVYATHANKLKTLANKARKEMLATKPTPYSPSAREAYATEVASLKAKLNLALKNAPLERQAQLLANKVVSTKKSNNPDMDKADLKKIKGQALNEARNRVGAKKEVISITDREWQAIQAGAVSTNTLNQILNNTKLDTVKQLATPRTQKTMSTAKLARARSMLASGFTQAEVAQSLGVSTSTLSKALN